MVTVEPATHDDITWPDREGYQDFERLLSDPQALVLVAWADTTAIGHAVAYLSASSPTRAPVTYGVLRSLYVDPRHRNTAVGSQLTEAFIAWARTHGCAEAHVESYSAYEAVQRFYERLGFGARSVSRALRL